MESESQECPQLYEIKKREPIYKNLALMKSVSHDRFGRKENKYSTLLNYEFKDFLHRHKLMNYGKSNKNIKWTLIN